MTSSTINNRTISHILSIMNKDSPQINKSEQENICQFLQRENERENVVRHALRPAIKRVECMRSIRARHDPFVVRLVESSIHARVVQASVDPVDEEIGETDEEGELEDTVVREWFFGDGIVEFGVSADFKDEEGGC